MGSTHHCKRSEVPPEAIDRQHSTPFCQGPAEKTAAFFIFFHCFFVVVVGGGILRHTDIQYGETAQ